MNVSLASIINICLKPRVKTNGGLALCGDTLICLWCEDDVVLEIELSVLVALSWLEFDNQVVLNGEHAIGLKVGVV